MQWTSRGHSNFLRRVAFQITYIASYTIHMMLFFLVKFWKHAISSASERAFPGFLGDIFGCSTLSKKRYFSKQEFTRFLSTVSSQRRTTRSDVSFQSWHPTHKYLWGRLCFVQACCLLSTVTVTPAETRIMSTEALLSKTVSVKIPRSAWAPGSSTVERW